MSTLATIDDLKAIRALPGNVTAEHPKARGALRLLELASAQAATHLGLTVAEANALPEPGRTVVAAVVAEAAARRLINPAGEAGTQLVDPGPFAGFASSLLTDTHRRALDELGLNAAP